MGVLVFFVCFFCEVGFLVGRVGERYLVFGVRGFGFEGVWSDFCKFGFGDGF